MIYDFAIIGAGIAGAGVAAEIAPHGSVLILEGEDQPGYHSTGRSNAQFHETYGGPKVSPLTTASRARFVEGGFAKDRTIITLGTQDDAVSLEAMAAKFADQFQMEQVDRTQIDSMFSGLLPQWQLGLLEKDCFDIDVAGYHSACLSTARKTDAVLETRARVTSITRQSGSWTVETSKGVFKAATLINAAGGWADEVATMAGVKPLGIQPFRRTIVQLKLARPVDPNAPFIVDINGGFYFRPSGPDQVWLSPHDEHETPACDAAPEEMDIAIAIDRFENVVDWPIARVEYSWAGLRCFAPDRLPVYGFDPDQPAFFWCAGQGGFGIQTAPAASELCASLILKQALSERLKNIDYKAYSPLRFY
jgi:D-arginine dehydrogenase